MKLLKKDFKWLELGGNGDDSDHDYANDNGNEKVNDHDNDNYNNDDDKDNNDYDVEPNSFHKYIFGCFMLLTLLAYLAIFPQLFRDNNTKQIRRQGGGGLTFTYFEIFCPRSGQLLFFFRGVRPNT